MHKLTYVFGLRHHDRHMDFFLSGKIGKAAELRRRCWYSALMAQPNWKSMKISWARRRRWSGRIFRDRGCLGVSWRQRLTDDAAWPDNWDLVGNPLRPSSVLNIPLPSNHSATGAGHQCFEVTSLAFCAWPWAFLDPLEGSEFSQSAPRRKSLKSFFALVCEERRPEKCSHGWKCCLDWERQTGANRRCFQDHFMSFPPIGCTQSFEPWKRRPEGTPQRKGLLLPWLAFGEKSLQDVGANKQEKKFEAFSAEGAKLRKLRSVEFPKVRECVPFANSQPIVNPIQRYSKDPTVFYNSNFM